MERRELLKTALAAGALTRAKPGGLVEALDARGAVAPDRPIVVDGLSAGVMRLSHLKGMQQGGVDCCVAGGPSDMESFAGLLRFFDEHSKELVLAKSVAEIRQAHHEGKASNVFCWQSAETLGSAFNSPLGSPRTTLRAFAQIGLRIVGLCYNVTNAFAAGC